MHFQLQLWSTFFGDKVNLIPHDAVVVNATLGALFTRFALRS